MGIFSLIQHPVVIIHPDDTKTTIEPSGTTLMLRSAEQQPLAPLEVDGRQVVVMTPQEFNDIYAVVKGRSDMEVPTVGAILALGYTNILVSMEVARFLLNTERGKELLRWVPNIRIFSPDTGPNSVVRDEKGAIVGVRRLVQYKF